MTDTHTHLKSLDWLREHLTDANLRIVDCRFVLGQPQAGRTAYDQSHIPGAIHADLEQDLSAPVAPNGHGGRHPLPDLDTFVRKLGQWGIDANTTVLAYDDQGGAMASRFWWMLTYLGHKNTYLLNGTLTHWLQRDLPVTAEVPSVTATLFTPDLQKDLLVSMSDVQAKRNSPDTVLIDSREPMRYRGEQEPIDKAAGHIPGAHNRFWKDALHADNTWKSPAEQQVRFAALNLDPQQEVIVYCGSGVTACPNVLALKEAGFEQVKLYLGSWSDWISYADNPIATDTDSEADKDA
ncbi:MAG TPA: sulfurtransferase [Bacilli bacterium]|nr:sulfurtransferase [Bacilli bacterium]